MSAVELVVLANSWKFGGRCLAGIELDTGKWVRPVHHPDDGRVPVSIMKLGGFVPDLLDIIEIPLASTGPDFGFESENRTLLPGKWRWLGKMPVAELEKYVDTPQQLLHNNERKVNPGLIRDKPFDDRLTLQLVHGAPFYVADRRAGPDAKPNWRGLFALGGVDYELPITDPAFCGKLNANRTISERCLLTVSLGMPHAPDSGVPPVCYKLLAGVIELN